jgi:hypothetical protein
MLMPHSAMVVMFARAATDFSVLNMAMLLLLLSFLVRVVCSIKPARNDPVGKRASLLRHGKSNAAPARRGLQAPRTLKKRSNMR